MDRRTPFRSRSFVLVAMATVGALTPVLAAGVGRAAPMQPPARAAAGSALGTFTPSAPDATLARLLEHTPAVVRAAERPSQFTPSTGSATPGTLTVATHVRSLDLRANLRTAAPRVRVAGSLPESVAVAPTLNVRPSTYSLGRSVGWKSFGAPGKVAEVDRALTRQPVARADEPAGEQSRFDSDFRLSPSTSPRLRGGDRSVELDMSGKYRVSRSIDLKAGVRYRSDRDRLSPDVQDSTDSSAVYVGTAFKF